jgi:hypothetical protein
MSRRAHGSWLRGICPIMKLEQLHEAVEKIAGDMIIDLKRLKDFQTWKGNLSLIDVGINSLEGCPQKIEGDFFCDNNHLKSLEGGPTDVQASYFCGYCGLESMKGCPEVVNDVLNCESNRLKSFEFFPSHVENTIDASCNLIESLHNIHLQIKSARQIILLENPIKSSVLGLLKIQNLENVTFTNSVLHPLNELEVIINKYLPLGNLLECQEELIEAGLMEFAQL